MLDKRRSVKGSYTVEASMVFTLIVLVVITLLFAFLYVQQKAKLVYAASFAAQQGAELWRDSRKDMEDGRVDIKKVSDSAGYRIFDNLLLSERTFKGYIEEKISSDGKSAPVLIMETGGGLPGKKASSIGKALYKKISPLFIKPENTRISITYRNNALRGRLLVEITQEIKIPLGGIKKFFDGKDTLTLSGSSSSSIVEPSEYIRNIDLAIELSQRLKEELDLMGLMEKIKSGGHK